MSVTGSTSVRMRGWCLRRSCHSWSDSQPSRDASLAAVAEVEFGVGDLSDDGPAVRIELAQLRGLESHGGRFIVQVKECTVDAGGALELGSRARAQLNVVNDGSYGYVSQRQAVARTNRRPLAGDHCVSGPQCQRSYYVAHHAVCVLNERHMRGSFGAVLDAQNGGGNVLSCSLVIDQSESVFVATALVSRGDGSGLVSTRM